MEAGCVGFSVQGNPNGDARNSEIKPQLGYYGNPPICFAVPLGGEPPVVLDAATCILADYQRGMEFDEMLSKIPAAFLKSIEYTAIASLLGGGLAGVTLPEAERMGRRWPACRGSGSLVLEIQIDAVKLDNVMRTETDRMVRDIRETYEPMPGL